MGKIILKRKTFGIGNLLKGVGGGYLLYDVLKNGDNQSLIKKLLKSGIGAGMLMSAFKNRDQGGNNNGKGPGLASILGTLAVGKLLYNKFKNHNSDQSEEKTTSNEVDEQSGLEEIKTSNKKKKTQNTPLLNDNDDLDIQKDKSNNKEDKNNLNNISKKNKKVQNLSSSNDNNNLDIQKSDLNSISKKNKKTQNISLSNDNLNIQNTDLNSISNKNKKAQDIQSFKSTMNNSEETLGVNRIKKQKREINPITHSTNINSGVEKTMIENPIDNVDKSFPITVPINTKIKSFSRVRKKLF